MEQSVTMNPLAVAISIFGVISSIFTCFMNIYLLKKVSQKKKDMDLFYYRFSLDVILGGLVAAFLGFVITFSFFPENLGEYQNLIFYLSLPASNVASARSIVTLSVAIERFVAVSAPIFYHKYRQHCPAFFILIGAITFGLSEDVVLYGICEFRLEFPKNCSALGCAVNSCFLRYWTTHKSTIFASTFLFAILLCAKLFFLSKSSKNGNVEWSRINRLAVFDAAVIFIFDFFPNFMANQFSKTEFFSFQNIGPYSAVTKMFGCAIEAYLVFRILIRDKGMVPSESSKSISKKESNNRKLTEVRIN